VAKIILCVDMDAFFASVEQRDNPALKGKPIAVTGAGERTIITTSSYEARAYGVKTAMTVYEAKRLCPHIILVTGDNKSTLKSVPDWKKSASGSLRILKSIRSMRSSST
jgi:DNA polymerase-4